MISTIVVGVIAALPRLRDLANLPGNPTRQQVAPILPGLLAILLSTLAVLILIYLVTRSLLSGLIAIVVSEDLVGRRIGVAAALSMIRPALGRLLIQGLLGGLALGVGLVLCVIPGLWLIGVWGVATPALALERASVPDSFTRSYTLVKKMFWRVFGIRALAFLAATVCSYVLSIPFNVTSSFGVNSSNSTIIILLCVLALAQFLVSLVTAPITAIVDAMLYIDLRIRKEGLAERLRAGIPARQF